MKYLILISLLCSSVFAQYSNNRVTVVNPSIPVTQSGAWGVSLTGATNGLALDASLTTLDASVNTLLKPASTLNAVTTVGTITNPVASTQSGTWNVNNISGTVSLPTGAATSALQTSGNASLTSIDTKLTSPLSVTGPLTDAQLRASVVPVSLTSTTISNFPATQPISAASLPLPSGAATETTLSALNTKVTAVNTGAVTVSTALPTGTNSIGQVTANAGTNLNTSALNLETTQSAMSAKLPASLGTKTIANSMAVNIASDQTVPVSGATGSNFTGFTALSSSATAKAAGIIALVTPDGRLNIANEGSNVFTETFDGSTLDTTDKWTTTLVSGGTATVALGDLTLATATTASRAAAVNTKGSFPPQALAYQSWGMMLKQEVAISTNTHRFWGVGTVPGSWTAATPLQDAIGFEVDIAGVMAAVIYENGVRTYQQVITAPTDGAYHRYGFRARADIMFFYLDSIEFPVGSASYLNPDSMNLPIRLHLINHTTPPASAPTFIGGAVGMIDGGANNKTISDGDFGWRKAKVTANKELVVTRTDGYKQTYSATSAAFSSANTATDIFTITGSATKTVRINKISLSCTQTTAGYFDVFLVKRSTANTGGTSAAVTAVPNDSANSAATATVLSYTVNPTTGTLVGNVRGKKVFVPAPATASGASDQDILFGDANGQSLVLRGTAQVLAINFNAATLTGDLCIAFVEWTEE